jgi:hypothetical protein
MQMLVSSDVVSPVTRGLQHLTDPLTLVQDLDRKRRAIFENFSSSALRF